MAKSLNDITADDLIEITKLAALMFTPREVAIMREIDADAFVFACDNDTNEVFNAFQSGRLQSQVDLRTSVLKLAKSGSSPAQAMVFELLKLSTLKMMAK